MMRSIALPFIFLVVAMTGCASKLVVTEISPDADPGKEINGLPFKVLKPYSAELYVKGAKGYEKVAAIPLTIADQKRLFVLGFESQTFSNSTLEALANLDNTISSVALTSKSTGQATMTALGTQINAIATAQQTRTTSNATLETGMATAAINADKAKQAADLAILLYKSAQEKPDTTDIDLLKASQAARSAQLDANEKARLAGKAPYFPDVVP